jgi:hypothetical protein
MMSKDQVLFTVVQVVPRRGGDVQGGDALVYKDRTHLRDLIEIGLIDATWPQRLAPELAARLQQLLDTPEG